MNLKEGTRRLALLLGVAGAIVGAIGSYSYLQPILHQQELHNRFEQLTNSDVVKRERKTLQAAPDFIPDTSQASPGSWTKNSATQNGQMNRAAVTPNIQGLPPGAILRPIQPDGAPIQFQYVLLPDGSYGKFNANATNDQIRAQVEKDFPDAYLSKGGITTIHWSHDYGVTSIETLDGQTLYPTAAPSAWRYLLITILPLFGFIIPWGVVRAIGWVGAGFVANTK